MGLVSTTFFGWLPFFLPALFPVRIRAAATGIAYNFGRVLSALALLSTTSLSALFQGNIAHRGAATSLVYAAGCLVAWFLPEQTDMDDHESERTTP